MEKRVIKFRSKRLNNGHSWEYGYYQYGVLYPNSHKTHTINGWEIDAETVGQFTGLTR